LWGPYIGFVSFAQFFFLLAPIFLLWLIGKKKRVLPWIIISAYALFLFFVLIDFVAVVTFISQVLAEHGAASDIRDQVMQSAQSVWKGMILCGIWIPYFLFSKRVRTTFTEPWSEGRRRMEADSRRSVVANLAAEKRALQEQESAGTDQAVQPFPARWEQPQPAVSYWPPAPAIRAKPRKIVVIPVIGVLFIVLGVVTALAAWRDMNPPQVKNPVTVSTDVNGNATKHYSNGSFSFSFDYPSDWGLQEDPTSDATAYTMVVYDPQGEQIDRLSLDSATFTAATYATSGRSLAEVFADLKDGFAQAVAPGALTIDEPFAETTASGLPAIKGTFSSTETDGTKVTASAYYVVGKDLVYYLEFDYTDRPTDTSKAELDAIMASFKPTP
jgi:hypothetical protein